MQHGLPRARLLARGAGAAVSMSPSHPAGGHITTVWHLLLACLQEVEALAGYHPYVTRQHVGQCCENLAGLFCFICIGFGMFNPDGGNYGASFRGRARWRPSLQLACQCRPATPVGPPPLLPATPHVLQACGRAR